MSKTTIDPNNISHNREWSNLIENLFHYKH